MYRMHKLKYRPYTLQNFRELTQIQKLTEEQKFEIEAVSHVLPFKTNSYVVEELINWDNVPNDPIFLLTFPQKDMLKPHHFNEMAEAIKSGAGKKKIAETAEKIRMELNPHPAGQVEHNIPLLDGIKLLGMQHKYDETVLFFPIQGQTCHAYCTFCFRWSQFVETGGLKFSMREGELLTKYILQHPEISDVLFTGGDPLIMKTQKLSAYIYNVLNADIPHLRTIRIGTKALGYWPYRFITDPDADELLDLFREVVRSGKHLTIMAHFNHPNELRTGAVKKAITRILQTGAQIRTQTPILAHINDHSELLTNMWNEQVSLGCIPYYLFVARDTGSMHYFSIPLSRAFEIFKDAYKNLSGIGKTVRGPIMSSTPGKMHILGTNKINGEKIFVAQFLQGRKPDWVKRPFFAKYDEKAVWLDELKPAFGEEKFFFE